MTVMVGVRDGWAVGVSVGMRVGVLVWVGAGVSTGWVLLTSRSHEGRQNNTKAIIMSSPKGGRQSRIL